MAMGIRKGMKETGKIEKKKEGIMMGRVKAGKERWKIVGLYAKREKMEETLKEIDNILEDKIERGFTIVGGDNARAGNKGGGVRVGEDEHEEDGWKKRESKDVKINKEGRKLIEWLGEGGREMEE